MVVHFSITPRGTPADIDAALTALAAKDARVLRVEAGARRTFFVCCATRDEALAEGYQAATTGQVSEHLGAVTLEGPTLRVDQACEESSRQVLSAFVTAALREFGPSFVFDEDAQANVSAEVMKDPAWLFR